MKRFVIALALPVLAGCMSNGPDSVYNGPVMNGKCALEVFPPKVAEQVEHRVDTAVKEDPLFRQKGMQVCRSF
jgi:hypothetical protein